MKKIILAFLLVCVSSVGFAVPRGIYLASPKKIEVVGEKLKLTFDLACRDEQPPDEFTGQLVAVSDDEGDRVVGVGVVLSKSRCKAGPVKEFTFEYYLKETGVSSEDLQNEGVTLEPIDIDN